MKHRYGKKPVVITAIQLPYLVNNKGFPAQIAENEDLTVFLRIGNVKVLEEKVEIQTLEGVLTGSPGDYIIQGVQGEFYPCKPDIFEMTYEVDN